MHDEILAHVHPVVLAAGRSARMGFPKILGDFEGKKGVELVIECIDSAALGRAVFVLGHDADRLRPYLPADRVTIVLNEHYDLGMTSSLQAGLAALPADAAAFLLFPGDFPLITGGDLRALAQAFAARETATKRIYMPVYRGRRGHPVLIDIALAEELRSLPQEETARSRIYADLSRVASVEVTNRGVLMDVDTPKDLAEAQREFKRQRGYTTRHITRTYAPKSPATPDAPAP